MDYNVVDISEEMGYVTASSYRTSVIRLLNDGNVRTPKEMCETLDMQFSNLSRATKELEEKGLVECMNPDTRKGKMKRITKKGEEVMKALESEGMLD